MAAAPTLIRKHALDNVAIVGNEGGLPVCTVLPGGVTLLDKVPQAHKVLLQDVPAGGEVLRYGVVIGRAKVALKAGCWVHERLLDIPPARTLTGLPMATRVPTPQPPLEGRKSPRIDPSLACRRLAPWHQSALWYQTPCFAQLRLRLRRVVVASSNSAPRASTQLPGSGTVDRLPYSSYRI